MNVNLVLLKKDGATQSFALPGNVITIGRRRDCDVCIPLSTISRKHCELLRNGGQFIARDCGSRNGTFLNDVRIEAALADAGDVLRIGPVRFVLQIDDRPSSFEQYLSKAALRNETTGTYADSNESTVIRDAVSHDAEAGMEEAFNKKNNLNK
ncbi:MAG: FHA domain-containing protein [Phycisphaerae bacterium]|nr:FHA domain-containing protein [Phycisphaerae bacterium]